MQHITFIVSYCIITHCTHQVVDLTTSTSQRPSSTPLTSPGATEVTVPASIASDTRPPASSNSNPANGEISIAGTAGSTVQPQRSRYTEDDVNRYVTIIASSLASFCALVIVITAIIIWRLSRDPDHGYDSKYASSHHCIKQICTQDWFT